MLYIRYGQVEDMISVLHDYLGLEGDGGITWHYTTSIKIIILSCIMYYYLIIYYLFYFFDFLADGIIFYY